MLRTLTAAALLTLAATAVQAQPLYQPLENSTIAVNYGDLNLSSPYDAKILADRLQAAAKQVCTATNYDLPKNSVSFCMDSAISQATSDIEYKVESHMGDQVHANLATVRQQISLN
jgi:UrcA family protein